MYGLGDLCSILKADEQAILVQHLDIADQLSDREFIEIREGAAGLFQCHIKFCQPAVEGHCASLLLFQLSFLGHELGFGHVDLLKFFIVVGTVSAGADCTDYDEELQQVYMAKTKLMAQKAELEKEQRGAVAFDSRLAELDMALEQASGALTDFDELTVRQLVSNIKVLDKDSLLICFKDGTEITQTIQRRRSA